MASNRMVKNFPFLFFFFILFFLTAAFASAQTTGQINVNLPGVPSAGANPGAWVKGFYEFSLMIAGLLGFAMIVYAGLRYAFAAGNPSTQSDARDQILQALLGLLLLFGAYIVLTTINPNLVNLQLPGLTKIERQGGATTQTATGNQRPIRIGATGTLTDAEAKFQLAPGIAVKPGASLQNIQSATINEVNTLKANCPMCRITISEGTGGVHNAGTFSHANGYKVDLRLDSSLNDYITKNFTYAGVRSDGAPQYKAPNGAIYAKEMNHWDVAVKS